MILAIPVLSLCFFKYAVYQYDSYVQEQIAKSVYAHPKLSPAEKQETITFFKEHPPSKILNSNDPALAAPRQALSNVAGDYIMFGQFIGLAWACIGVALAAMFLAGIGVLLSFHSQVVQFWTLASAWHLLKLVAVVEVIGQGILLVAFSYWGTAVFFERYYVKLILCIGLLVLVAAFAILKAMFVQLDDTFEINGEVIEPDRAPALVERLAALASSLDIKKPDWLVVGIDDNFFVTEHTVTVRGKAYAGRTLYVSLPLLKIMEREEADAVLSHELAHFSGQDTLYSRKIAPILGRYGAYLGTPLLPYVYLLAHKVRIDNVGIYLWNDAERGR